MKAVFSVGGDGGSFPQPHYDVTICFNGVPGTVILEVEKTDWEQKEPGDPWTTKKSSCVMRSALKPSHARAIASALLSAATEVQSSQV